MAIHKFTFEIEAETPEKARQIAQALNVAYKKIPIDDLIWIGQKIQQDPNVIKKVKNIANNPIVKRLW